MNIFWFIMIGLIAGWLATALAKGGATGLFEYILVGVVGSLIGGFIFHRFGFALTAGLLGSIATATAGAMILIFSLKVIKRT